jgi:hypothetical protein
MAHVRSRRLRLLESLRRTLSEMLHERVWKSASRNGRGEPVNTSAIYTAAIAEDPDLLDQLLLVHHRVRQEQGEIQPDAPTPQTDDGERRRMLSAVRATVRQSAARFHQ